MKSSKRVHTISTISTILIILAFVFLFFSFIAPHILSRKCSSFSETGQIGDTIGGLMNPFIAISGVITTFLAFLLQIEANKLQRQQFLKVLQKEKEKEENDCLYYLQILNIDLKNIIKSIDTNIACINLFTKNIQLYPLQTANLQRTSLQQFYRPKRIPRELIFRGFELYIKPIDSNWISIFNNFYNSLDFIPEAFKNVYQFTDHYRKGTYDIRIMVKEQLTDLESNCIKVLYHPDKTLNNTLSDHIKQFLSEFHEETTNSCREVRESNFFLIRQILQTYITNLEALTDLSPYSYRVQQSLISNMRNVIKLLNEIQQQTSLLIPELKKAVSDISNDPNSSKNKLQAITHVIDKAISIQNYKTNHTC